MARKDEHKEKKLNLDFGIGSLKISGFLDGIEKMVDFASQLKKSSGNFSKEQELDLSHIKEGMKGVYGFSFRYMNGEPVIETFGNVKKTDAGPKVDDVREPLADVFDEKDEIIILLEMPGVNAEEIKVDVKEDILEINAEGKERKYHKEILLPTKVKAETLTSAYKTGIFEVRIKK